MSTTSSPSSPTTPDFDWSEDNYGPIWIPKAGVEVSLTTKNLPLFERLIRVYEHHDLRVRDGVIMIDGVATDRYTVEQDYYWLMGDNRHRSQDARFWGYVPFDHVVGKAVLVWLTVDPQNGGFPTGIRWKRLFTKVR
jgi:signal peptidase I